mmetsp:Transcript_519/g.581  ORF Transcript_519/g.581 Transcript_519/m.581 type:complete len:84 (+) Transcript_519:162-413(+)
MSFPIPFLAGADAGANAGADDVVIDDDDTDGGNDGSDDSGDDDGDDNVYTAVDISISAGLPSVPTTFTNYLIVIQSEFTYLQQ